MPRSTEICPFVPPYFVLKNRPHPPLKWLFHQIWTTSKLNWKKRRKKCCNPLSLIKMYFFKRGWGDQGSINPSLWYYTWGGCWLHNSSTIEFCPNNFKQILLHILDFLNFTWLTDPLNYCSTWINILVDSFIIVPRYDGGTNRFLRGTFPFHNFTNFILLCLHLRQ